eukprot:TRINITY_DN84695_c0_g1_i1.p1 TRINITY_DN84695_c0_g1~~TRINITY_DN84695_c0_g1_i1.p1  ORF type:complete len:169 (+),score=14.25 TRINITY_DN84695_c0_g1_i1:26-532(+)
MEVRPAQSEEDVAQFRQMLVEYKTVIDKYIDINDYHPFDQEVKDLPTPYDSASGGCIMTGWVGNTLAACIAVKNLECADGIKTCEMKRLYVRPAFEGRGFAKQLLNATLHYVKEELGYSRARCDSFRRLHVAVRLYENLGFTPCEKFSTLNAEDGVWMQLMLDNKTCD